MNILYLFFAVIWLFICLLTAKLIVWLFKRFRLDIGLVTFDLVMWSLAYVLVVMIEQALNFRDSWSDLMFFGLWLIMVAGVLCRWKRHGQFKA